jgi:hypothetical protein
MRVRLALLVVPLGDAVSAITLVASMALIPLHSAARQACAVEALHSLAVPVALALALLRSVLLSTALLTSKRLATHVVSLGWALTSAAAVAVSSYALSHDGSLVSHGEPQETVCDRRELRALLFLGLVLPALELCVLVAGMVLRRNERTPYPEGYTALPEVTPLPCNALGFRRHCRPSSSDDENLCRRIQPRPQRTARVSRATPLRSRAWRTAPASSSRWPATSGRVSPWGWCSS